MSLIGQVQVRNNNNQARVFVDGDIYPQLCYDVEPSGQDIGWSETYGSYDFEELGPHELTAEAMCEYWYPGTTPTILFPENNEHPCDWNVFNTYDCVGDEEEEEQPPPPPLDPPIIDPRHREYFDYLQKTSQAFIILPTRPIQMYFGEEATTSDVFIAYCYRDEYNRNPSVIGATAYRGEDYVTVPVMGTDAGPYLDNIAPLPYDHGRLYCDQGAEIFIDLVKSNDRVINLNSVYDWPTFTNSMIHVSTLASTPDDLDDGLGPITPTDCNCRTFECRQCDQDAASAEINNILRICCRECCGDDPPQCIDPQALCYQNGDCPSSDYECELFPGYSYGCCVLVDDNEEDSADE